jgi:hypothetical protein
MLDSLLSRLQKVGEICHTEGIEVGILGSDEALVSRIRRTMALQAVACLEAVDPAIAAATARCVHGRTGARARVRVRLQQRG